jgi:hypothetical protein
MTAKKMYISEKSLEQVWIEEDWTEGKGQVGEYFSSVGWKMVNFLFSEVVW